MDLQSENNQFRRRIPSPPKHLLSSHLRIMFQLTSKLPVVFKAKDRISTPRVPVIRVPHKTPLPIKSKRNKTIKETQSNPMSFQTYLTKITTAIKNESNLAHSWNLRFNHTNINTLGSMSKYHTQLAYRRYSRTYPQCRTVGVAQWDTVNAHRTNSLLPACYQITQSLLTFMDRFLKLK